MVEIVPRVSDLSILSSTQASNTSQIIYGVTNAFTLRSHPGG